MPAREFYSGVAKFVGIENNKIKLGFLHDNTLAQAKSEMKLSQLKNALSATYQGYEVEFLKIDANKKVIEFKPKFAPAPKPQAQPVSNSQAPTSSQNPIKQEELDNSENDEEETNKAEKRHYSPKVQEMIEQFKVRIIE